MKRAAYSRGDVVAAVGIFGNEYQIAQIEAGESGEVSGTTGALTQVLSQYSSYAAGGIAVAVTLSLVCCCCGLVACGVVCGLLFQQRQKGQNGSVRSRPTSRYCCWLCCVCQCMCCCA